MKAKCFTIRQLLTALIVSLCLMLAVWTYALWLTGGWFNYRADKDDGLVVLHLAPEAGLSLQWSASGYSIWVWNHNANVRAMWGKW